jgi:hypothetical protein
VLLFALELLWAQLLRSKYPGEGLAPFLVLCALAALVPLALNLALFHRRLGSVRSLLGGKRGER